MAKLSIITINLNNVTGLQKTMESVFTQTYSDYEYIIIDGGSTDGSKEYIENHSEKLAYRISEKDQGIYNAMNKGIQQANGQYLQFLNSGDLFFSKNTLNELFNSERTQDILYGNFVDQASDRIYKMPELVTFRFFYKQSINHQACFIKRDLFIKYGLYDEETKIIADWEFFMKCIFLQNATTKYIDKFLIAFDFENSISNKKEMMETIQKERERILEKYFPLIVPDMEYIDKVEGSTTFKYLKKITRLRRGF